MTPETSSKCKYSTVTENQSQYLVFQMRPDQLMAAMKDALKSEQRIFCVHEMTLSSSGYHQEQTSGLLIAPILGQCIHIVSFNLMSSEVQYLLS